MSFDKVEDYQSAQYGVINGSRRLLYIKAGHRGTIFGYHNKYLEIATDASTKYGCSVLVASNPGDMREAENIARDMSYIQNCFSNQIEEIRCMGVSNGGQMFLQQAWKYPLIHSVLSINAPLFINWHKTKMGLMVAPRPFICMYGTNDQSYQFAGLLEQFSNVKIVTVEGADHRFSQHYAEFRYAVNMLFETDADDTRDEG